jgi:carbon storage regulator
MPGLIREGGTGMLVFTRSIGETFYIGDDVSVTILGLKGNRVRVGVSAPEAVPVHREEIYEHFKKEKDRSEG